MGCTSSIRTFPLYCAREGSVIGWTRQPANVTTSQCYYNQTSLPAALNYGPGVGISSPVCCCQAFDKAGPYSYGLYSSSLYGYGLYTYGLHSCGQVFDKAGFGSALAKHVAVSIWVHPIFPKKKRCTDVCAVQTQSKHPSVSVLVRVRALERVRARACIYKIALHGCSTPCFLHGCGSVPASCKGHFSYHFQHFNHPSNQLECYNNIIVLCPRVDGRIPLIRPAMRESFYWSSSQFT